MSQLTLRDREASAPFDASQHQCDDAFNPACLNCQQNFQIQRKIHLRDFWYTCYAVLFKASKVFAVQSRWLRKRVSSYFDPSTPSNMFRNLVFMTELANLFETNPLLPGLHEAFEVHCTNPCEESYCLMIDDNNDKSYMKLLILVHDAFKNAEEFHFCCVRFPTHVDGFLLIIENLPENLKMYFDLDEIRRQVREIHKLAVIYSESIPKKFTNCTPDASINELNDTIHREMISRWNFISGECVSRSLDLMKLIRSQFLIAFRCYDMKIWKTHNFSLD